MQKNKTKKYNTKKIKTKKMAYKFWTILTSLIIGTAIIGNADIRTQKAMAEMQDVNTIQHIEKEEVKKPSMQEWVMSRVREAGLNEYEAWAIINCESKWNPNAMNTKNRDGSYDMGLFQINSVHKDISNANKLDYKKATEWAIKKRLHDGNWSAWACSSRI